MKLDNKPQPSFPSKEHKMKVVECNGNHEPKALTLSNDVRSESKCNYITLAECLSREKAFESSHQASDIGKGGTSVNHDESADVHATSYVPLPEFEMDREKNDFHAEKAVMEIEQPKMIVCFERDEKQVIKDIGIDEGMHSSDSVLQEKDNKETAKFLTVFSNDEKHTTSSNSIHDSDSLKSPFPDRNSFVVDTEEDSLQHFSGVNVDNSGTVDKTLDHVPNKESTSSLPADQEHGRESHEVCSSDIIYDEQGATCVVTENVLPGNSGSSGPNSPDGPNQGTLEPGSSSIPAVEPAGKPELVDGSTDSSVDRQNLGPPMPSRDADTPLAIADKEIKTTGHQHGNQAIIGEMPGENLPTSRNPFLHHGLADDSVYGPHVLSDRINYTGHVAYSGSTSLRSDSSTTSTRSFAFPILQSEWNSSPVKMAKADRRHYRKYRGWRSYLLCCRF